MMIIKCGKTCVLAMYKHIRRETLNQCWLNVSPPSTTSGQQWTTIESTSRVCWDASHSKHNTLAACPTLNQCCLRRWPNRAPVYCVSKVFDVGPTLYKYHTNVLCLLLVAPDSGRTTKLKRLSKIGWLGGIYKVCRLSRWVKAIWCFSL